MTMQRVTRSRGGAAVGANPPRADPGDGGSVNGNFHVEDELSVEDPADSQLLVEQDTMSVLPLNMLDGEIVKLRSSFITNRKFLDDVKEEIQDQMEVINQAKERNVGKPVMIRYTKILDSLLNDGDKKLNTFTEQTDALLHRMEMLILKLENSDPQEHARVVVVRNKLVGEAKPTKGSSLS